MFVFYVNIVNIVKRPCCCFQVVVDSCREIQSTSSQCSMPLNNGAVIKQSTCYTKHQDETPPQVTIATSTTATKTRTTSVTGMRYQ